MHLTANERLARARTFSLLSLVTTYPGDDLAEGLRVAHDWMGPRAIVATASLLERAAALDDLRGDYLGLFDGGGDRASLYETEYGRMRGMAKGNDLADIAGFYEAFGLALDPEAAHEMLDHVAVELEFYSVLLLKEAALVEIGDEEGRQIVEDARKKFLVDHLGRLAGAIAARKEVGGNGVYGPVFAWCAAVVDEECATLGVTPAPLDFFADAEAKKDMGCGSVHLPVVQ